MGYTIESVGYMRRLMTKHNICRGELEWMLPNAQILFMGVKGVKFPEFFHSSIYSVLHGTSLPIC